MPRQLGAYARRHPLLALEHFAFIVLLLLYFQERRKNAQCPPALPQEGPLDVFELGSVSKAPKPSMSIAALRDGEFVDHHDARGDIYRFRLGSGVILNMYKTVAGNKRSGDLHNCTQFNVIVRGKAVLTTLDPRTGKETVAHYNRNELIRIPARVPHLYEFPEDNYLLEWWDCPFEAWYYDPYRTRIAT